MAIADDWPGDPDSGRSILEGTLPWRGRTTPVTADTWAPAVGCLGRHLHSFTWLRDLREVGGDAARLKARELITGWIDEHERWSRDAWRADVTGSRVAAWLGHFDAFWHTGEEETVARITANIAAQVRHLAGSLDSAPEGSGRLEAIHGLIAGLVGLFGQDTKLEKPLAALEREITQQIDEDGAHRSRSPILQLAVMAILVDLRKILRTAKVEPPVLLEDSIQQMAVGLRLLRHGDGGLALFNGSDEGPAWLIDAVLARSEAKRRTSQRVSAGGFHRLSAARTQIIVDGAEPSAMDATASAGVLAFEMSVGKQRLIVNCGASPGDKKWGAALKATAAHSTLVVDDRNAVALDVDGVPTGRPSRVTAQRQQDGGAVWIEMEQDGYQPTHGLLHRRRLYLSPDGTDVRGEDVLTYNGEPGETPREAVIRFHLHPKISATILQKGSAALLKPVSGGGWRLISDGGVALEDSIYFGADGPAQRTSQIVVRRSLEDVRSSGELKIRWAIRREDAKGTP